MAVLNTLGLHSDKRIILLGADEVAFAVADSSLSVEVGEGAAVSVLPLGPCTATTKGLVWDLNALNMQLGKAISSSNRAADTKIQIMIEGKAIVTVPKAALPAAITAVRGE
jgi:thiamine pyrophosphokinase